MMMTMEIATAVKITWSGMAPRNKNLEAEYKTWCLRAFGGMGGLPGEAGGAGVFCRRAA